MVTGRGVMLEEMRVVGPMDYADGHSTDLQVGDMCVGGGRQGGADGGGAGAPAGGRAHGASRSMLLLLTVVTWGCLSMLLLLHLVGLPWADHIF